MPFTLSHTVAVIPLYKYLGKFGALSALIIGSMTPDFAYLTPYLVHQRMDSHSLVGIYLYAIPMGLTVYFLYHLLMAPVIVSLLPKTWQKHLAADLFMGRLPNIPSHILVFSLVVGALTHVFWDFFTHSYGIPQYIHWMDVPLTSIDGYDFKPYRILQHFSTIFGLSFLLFLMWKWLQRKKNQNLTSHSQELPPKWQASKKLKTIALLVLLIVPAVIGIYNGITNHTDIEVMYGIYSAQVFIRYAVVGAAAGFIACCVLLGLIYQYFIYKQDILKL